MGRGSRSTGIWDGPRALRAKRGSFSSRQESADYALRLLFSHKRSFCLAVKTAITISINLLIHHYCIHSRN